ncbi:MAG TPA: acyltransferase [Acidobacteriaceae bacterium]|nr:acyltransferase [Acidobacteriaceae bacterium]
MASEHSRQPRREIELDFLRGIAILLVVDVHSPYSLGDRFSGWLGINPVGEFGVPIFFVLSGFLVGGLLIKEWKVRGRIDGKRFLIRRGFKVWPQFYLFLILTVITGHRSMAEMWPSFLNIQNYFPGGSAHLWSLAIEEHAYIFLTVLLLAAGRVGARLRSIFVILAVLSVACSGLRLYSACHGYSYFSPTHTRLSGIFYGVMLAIVYHSAPEIFRRMQSWWWLWFGLILGACAFFRFNAHHPWTLSVAIDMDEMIGVCALMLLYKHRPGRVRPWPYRLVAWIGLYSYGIYLWHVLPLAPLERAEGRMPGHLGAIVVAIMGPLAGILLGASMTKLVEFPMLRVRDRLFPRRVVSAVEDTPAESRALVQ